jgi:hypothetical protein
VGHVWDKIDCIADWVDQLTSLWKQGAIKPKIARTFPFGQAAAAHHFIQDHKNIGTVLLTPYAPAPGFMSPEIDCRRRGKRARANEGRVARRTVGRAKRSAGQWRDLGAFYDISRQQS